MDSKSAEKIADQVLGRPPEGKLMLAWGKTVEGGEGLGFRAGRGISERDSWVVFELFIRERLKELEDAGFDLKTLKFEIKKKKEVPNVVG